MQQLPAYVFKAMLGFAPQSVTNMQQKVSGAGEHADVHGAQANFV